MEKEGTCGYGNVVGTRKKVQKHGDPVPFLRNPSRKFWIGAEIKPLKRRVAPTYGPMDNIYHQEK